MKNLKFVDFCKGIMFLLIGVGIASFGIASISNNSAKADNPTAINSTGKIMMHQNSFIVDGDFNFTILVWDTETGKSKMYTFVDRRWSNDIAQLPSSPIY
jgi:hypothetical protein